MNDKKLHDIVSTLPNTTAGRRARRLALTRYRWVSKSIPAEVYQLAQSGAQGAAVASRIIAGVRGDTQVLGRNALKRACDVAGSNNKWRRTLRSFHLSALAARMEVSHA